MTGARNSQRANIRRDRRGLIDIATPEFQPDHIVHRPLAFARLYLARCQPVGRDFGWIVEDAPMVKQDRQVAAFRGQLAEKLRLAAFGL